MEPTELQRAALRGEKAAWSALISTHNHRVVVALLAKGVSLERAKELAQETWLALMVKQSNGQLARLELPGLAIRQACYLALDEGRQTRRAQLHLASHVESADSLDVEAQFLNGERARRARAVIATCSASTQAVFHRLCAAPDLTHAELAAEVGLSVDRVKHILCDLRKTLRVALFEETP